MPDGGRLGAALRAPRRPDQAGQRNAVAFHVRRSGPCHHITLHATCDSAQGEKYASARCVSIDPREACRSRIGSLTKVERLATCSMSTAAGMTLPPLGATARSNTLKLGMGRMLVWSEHWSEHAARSRLATLEPTSYVDALSADAAPSGTRWAPLLPLSERRHHSARGQNAADVRAYTARPPPRAERTARRWGRRTERRLGTAVVATAAPPTWRAQKARRSRARVERQGEAPYWWPSNLPQSELDQQQQHDRDGTWRTDVHWQQLYSTRHRRPFCTWRAQHRTDPAPLPHMPISLRSCCSLLRVECGTRYIHI